MKRSTVLVLILAAMMTACVGGDTKTAGPSRAELVVRFSGDPLNSAPTGGSDAAQYPRMVQFNLIVSDVAGVGANMINQTLVTSPDSGNIKVLAAAPSGTIPAAGSITIPMTLMFSKFPGGGLTLALTVNALDVAGNLVTGIGTVRVN